MLGGSVFAGLFAAAFLAATIVPFSSEIVLATALTTSGQPWTALIAIATVGNVLGSIVNWYLGRALASEKAARIIRVKRENLARAESWYHRWGRWSLLLSWAPVIGDPLTVVAGFLREPLWFFIPVVIVAKTGRYLAVAAFTAGLI
jgi:membrane protein YqaA with SNARE-associated domain